MGSGGETRERQRSSLAISSRREPPKYIRRLPRFSKGGWGSDSCLKNNNLKKKRTKKETTARPPRRLYKHKKNFEIRNRKKLKRNHFTHSRTHTASRETTRRRKKIVLIPYTFNYLQNQNIFHERKSSSSLKRKKKPRYIRIYLRDESFTSEIQRYAF